MVGPTCFICFSRIKAFRCMNTIIINADDCGKSLVVNKAIRDCIDNNLITSTTIMANMDDFEGAIELYNEYSERISFGLHITLDEGEPLLKNELLLEKGFYKETGERVIMAIPNIRKPISPAVSNAIYNEIEAQLVKLLDNGVKVTHIDSHHHVHSSPFILPLVMKLSKKYGIYKVRGIRNYYSRSLNEYMRYGWKIYARILNSKCIMTDYFCSTSEYLNSNLKVSNSSVELMCHPGHPKSCFVEEIEILKRFMKMSNCGVTFISYSDFGK